MKKLVALAVASVIAAPALAEVNITGNFEYALIERTDTNVLDTSNSHVDGNVNITHSAELDNGIKVRTTFDFTSDANRDGAGAHGLNISGAFGSLNLGEGNGAVDNLDAGDFTNVVGNGVDGRHDASVVYTLPTFMPGLRVAGHFSPENDDSGEEASTNGDLSGVSIRYSFPGGSVGYAFEDEGTNNIDGIFLTYGIAGASFAYDSIDEEAADGNVTEGRQWSIQYAVSDALTLGYGVSTTKLSNAATKSLDQTFMGAYLNVAGNLGVFVEYSENDGTASGVATLPTVGATYVPPAEMTVFGVTMSF